MGDSLDSTAAPESLVTERVLARVGDPRAGNTVLVVAGIHGNEPAGVIAARRVLAQLTASGAELAGELVLLSGNRRALAEGRRFVERDLNRGWSAPRIRELRHATSRLEGTPTPLSSEDSEQLDLLAAIDQVIERSFGAVYFLDLHTTSSSGYPFAMIMDGSPQRLFAYHFPLPIILGLLDQIDGVLLKYMHARGCVALGIEGGQNEDPRSVAHHEAVLWIALGAAGLIPSRNVPEVGRHRAVLTQASYGCPRILEVVHRHSIRDEDRFRMEPGFANIHRVTRGTLLAQDRSGEIRAPEDGVVFLPLYQAQGDDGFFFGREIQP
ncbi:MAG: succinylglutamate desuccinylase/aspartoacylase family protein [Candidatus Eisenbacteria bacterium]